MTHHMVPYTWMMVGATLIWGGLCALAITATAHAHGHSASFVTTANAWAAVSTLPALIAVGVQRSSRRRAQWFLYLTLTISTSMSAGLMLSIVLPSR